MGLKPSQNATIQTLEADTTLNVSGDIQLQDGGEIGAAVTHTGTGSYQPLWADLTLGAAAGSADGKFLGSVMGNTFGENLTKAGNYIGGGIFHYNISGTNATTYPSGAVLAGVGDGTTTAKGAVVAYIDGDSAQTNAGAAFKVMNNNSTAASGFEYGLDLQDATHDGYQPVDKDFYTKAPVRLVSDVVMLVGAGAPTDGGAGTGLNFAGPGSLYIDTTNAEVYVQTTASSSPTWKKVTRAS
jgi:hypothetical protein